MNEFDAMAKNFDTGRRIERSEAIAGEIRLHICNGNEKTAIEFGCGTGLVGFQLIDDFSTVLFVDSSEGMIEQVKKKLASLDKPLSSAVCCDIMTDTSHGLRADYIFTSLVLHHIQDTKAALSRLYDMLNRTGRLLIVDLDADDGSFHAQHSDFCGHNGFNKADLIDLAKKAGFSKVEAKDFYYGSKIVNGKEIPHSFFILDAVKCGITSSV